MRNQKFLSLTVLLYLSDCSARRLQKPNNPLGTPTHTRRLLKPVATPTPQTCPKYKPLGQPIPLEEQQPVTIIVYDNHNPTDNPENKTSILQQRYEVYRVIYLDNKHAKNILEALYATINSCNDDEIIVLLKGNDWFANEWALTTICRAYTKKNVWLTYGSSIPSPKRCALGIYNKPLPDAIRQERAFRTTYSFMPPYSFYAWLFKKIKKEDLIDPQTGRFFEHAIEAHIMWPLLEMAPNRSTFLKPTNYVVNCQDPLKRLNQEFYKRKARNTALRGTYPLYKALDHNEHAAKGSPFFIDSSTLKLIIVINQKRGC